MTPPRRGPLIAVEGIDGVGKSHHVQELATWLRATGRRVLVTREPGGTPRAEAIRACLWNGTPITPETALLLLFAARHDHWHDHLAPALAAGDWVITDRFIDSTYAYQGGGEGVATARIAALERWVGCDWQPDAVIWLTVDAATAAARRVERGLLGGFDGEQAAFFARVTAEYARRVAQHPCHVVIDTADAPDAVAARIAAWIETQVMPRWPLLDDGMCP